jgi:hypothetical protein
MAHRYKYCGINSFEKRPNGQSDGGHRRPRRRSGLEPDLALPRGGGPRSLRRSLWVAAAILLTICAPAHAAATLVRAGDNLQAALNAAQPGDVLMLEAGATFTGNFTLPVKAGSSFITIRSSAPDVDLPAAGTRITPAYAARLPKIRSPNTAPALRAEAGAHHWRLQCLEFPSTQLGYGEILRVGEGSSAQSTLAQVPYEIEIDRVYVHGDALYGQKRGIALNGRSVTIRNSYVSEIKAVGFDTQAIGGWNGPGPFTIENNFLQGAGENFILGGSDPAIPNLVSENVVVRYNYMSKPMAWRDPVIAAPSSLTASALPGAGTLPAGAYAYRIVARRPVGGGTIGRSAASIEVSAEIPAGAGAVALAWGAVANAAEYRVYGRNQYWTVSGTSFTDNGTGGTAGAAPTGAGDTWQVKNLFELKNARRVLVEYNVFENNWDNAQPGYAILFTPRNQDGGCPWCVLEDITFQFNVVRNSPSGINLSGYDWPNTSAQTNNIRIRHNLFYGLTQSLGGAGWFLLIGDQPRDILVDHNTIDFDGTTAVYAYGGTAAAPKQITGFQFTNNATRHGQYGVNGANFSPGTATLAAYFPNAIVQGNWLQGGPSSRYPGGNLFSGTFAAAFTDAAGGDYRAAAASVLLNAATNRTNIGADTQTLLSGLRGVIEGTLAARPGPPANLRVVVR